jgi:hypothetical protein
MRLIERERMPAHARMLVPKRENDTEVDHFLRNEHPSVSLALPPVGWQSTVVHPWHITTVCACEKTVVMVKQPGHLTSMKKDRGAGTRVYGQSATQPYFNSNPQVLHGDF